MLNIMQDKPHLPKPDIGMLVEKAIGEVKYLLIDEQFMVSDLFIGYRWKRLSNYERAQVGQRFYHEYATSAEGKSKIDILGKTARNQQLYKRK